MTVQRGPKLNKFEQVSILGHQMSLARRGQDPVDRGRGAEPCTEEGQSPVKREQGPVQREGGCTVKFNAS